MVAPLAVGAQTLGDIRGQLDEVRARRAALEDRMSDTQQRLEDLHARRAALEAERDALLREVERYDRDMAELQGLIEHRVREQFKHGAAMDPVAVFLASEDPFGALSRAETIQWLVAGDRTRVDSIAAARTQSQAARALLDDRTRQLDEATVEFDALEASLQEDLAQLQSLEGSLSARERDELARLERERRQRAEAEAARRAEQEQAPPASEPEPPRSGGAMACPIDRPHSFIDSWGHPRSGGRRHRGTDLMAPHGIPNRAITDGVWEHRRTGASAGIWGVLRGDNGDAYWYMHLASHTAGNGARVSAGQQIGTNGSTGNATTPHLHFEHHPGGGGAINPYPLLRRVC